jgi:hypothetical protein
MNRGIQIDPQEAIGVPPPCATWFFTHKTIDFNKLSGTKKVCHCVPLALFVRIFHTKWHKVAWQWHTFCCATYLILFKIFTYKNKASGTVVAQPLLTYHHVIFQLFTKSKADFVQGVDPLRP